MEHLIDILGIGAIIISAATFLIKSFKKAKSGCSSICSGCSNSCQTRIKQFKPKAAIVIKRID